MLIALVSRTPLVSFRALGAAAEAVDHQLREHVAPVWAVDGTVVAVRRGATPPADAWTVTVQSDLPAPGVLGLHQNVGGRPSATVAWTQYWTVTASHEVIEMVVDPEGTRFVPGPSPRPAGGPAEFLVEVCDPCAAPSDAYRIGAVEVSSFTLPRYWDTSRAGALSVGAAVRRRLQVRPGGYLRWRETATGDWWEKSKPLTRNVWTRLGPVGPGTADQVRRELYVRSGRGRAGRMPSIFNV